jgi:hypothetical protein
MTIPDPTYITVDEVKEQTRITGLEALDDDDVAFLIQNAEDQIDAYVKKQPHHPNDTNIERVFPRVQDYQRTGTGSGIDHDPCVPAIPYKVSLACLRQVEWLYSQWWPNVATEQIPVVPTIESEDIGADGSYAATFARGGMNLDEASLCDQAKLQLDGFVSRFTGLSTSHPNR